MLCRIHPMPGDVNRTYYWQLQYGAVATALNGTESRDLKSPLRKSGGMANSGCLGPFVPRFLRQLFFTSSVCP